MAKRMVKVLQGWTGGPYGSREPGDRFKYDIVKDDARLKDLGLVEALPAPRRKGK